LAIEQNFSLRSGVIALRHVNSLEFRGAPT